MHESASTSLFKRMLIQLTGSRLAQRLLQKNIAMSQELMGIGTGISVSNSGETAVLEHLKQHFAGPYRIFDVGSNRGQFLDMAFSHLPGDQLEVHCFEPGAQTFKHLTAAAAGRPGVILNNVALGKATGEAVLHYDTEGSELASLTHRRLEHLKIAYEGSEKVTVKTVDSYCAEKGIHHIHLLKVDVEGHEMDCFAGARRMFLKKAIDMVTLEFGGCNIDTRSFFRDFWFLFERLDMDLYRITPSGYLFPITKYYEIQEQFRTTNYMAVRRLDKPADQKG